MNWEDIKPGQKIRFTSVDEDTDQGFRFVRTDQYDITVLDVRGPIVRAVEGPLFSKRVNWTIELLADAVLEDGIYLFRKNISAPAWDGSLVVKDNRAKPLGLSDHYTLLETYFGKGWSTVFTFKKVDELPPEDEWQIEQSKKLDNLGPLKPGI